MLLKWLKKGQVLSGFGTENEWCSGEGLVNGLWLLPGSRLISLPNVTPDFHLYQSDGILAENLVKRWAERWIIA